MLCILEVRFKRAERDSNRLLTQKYVLNFFFAVALKRNFVTYYYCYYC